MSVEVRRAGVRDIDAVAPMFDAYRQFYSQPGDPALARGFLHDRIARDESVLLLAERNGIAVGFTQLFPMFSSVRAARIWVLNDLYVAAEARRGGVARSLLDAAAQFARADGAARIVLETAPDNTAARALYRGAGWEEDDSQWYGLSLAARSE
ncbi:MAG TPA: GNAT family N-acetyltransferase [Lysobacter sp.]|nr:GNAT family N-acetyltransferase [Lysobacter sp.]